MSTVPQSATSGLPGQHTTGTLRADDVGTTAPRSTAGHSDQVGTEGIVPTVLSYVGLSPSQSRDEQPHATDDRGVVAGIGTGAAAATGAAGMAIQQGHGPLAAAAGSLAAAGAAGAAVYGGSKAGANDATAEPAFGASVSPTTSRGDYTHDSERAREVAARATGGTLGYGQDSSSQAHRGLDGNSGVSDNKVRDTTGVGAVGAGSSTLTGTSTGAHHAGNDRFGSSSGIGAGNDRLDSTRRDATGSDRFGSNSGIAGGNDRFGSSSGIAGGNDRFDSTGRDATGSDRFGSSSGIVGGNDREGARHPTQAGLEGTTDRTEDRKTSRAVQGASEGAHPSESQTTAEHNRTEPKGGSTRGNLENKNAIPVAGGIKLGEKHWGESDFIPENPKPRQENISSSEGQPDQSTRDNTAANTGEPDSSEQKEGIVGKVKDALHIGHKE